MPKAVNILSELVEILRKHKELEQDIFYPWFENFLNEHEIDQFIKQLKKNIHLRLRINNCSCFESRYVRPIKQLTKEYEAIKQLLRILEKICYKPLPAVVLV